MSGREPQAATAPNSLAQFARLPVVVAAALAAGEGRTARFIQMVQEGRLRTLTPGHPMEISKSFVVNAPAAAAWEFLTEPARVVRCLPGATLGEQVDEHSHAGTISIKVGPVQASYRGTMKFERLDRDALTAEISAQGQETRGRGGAKMTMTSRLVEITPGETEIHVTSDVQVMGVLAQFGRGMIQDVSDQLFQKFVDCARATLEAASPAESIPAAGPVPVTDAGPPIDPGSAVPSAAAAVPLAAASAVPTAALPAAGEPIDALSLGGAALGRAAGRAARRPAIWVAIAAIVAVLVWLFRR